MYLLNRIAVKHIKAANTLIKNTRKNQIRYLNATLQTKVQQESKNVNENTLWTRIYYFPYIRHAAVLNRFKLYQTSFTTAAIPVSTVLYNYGMIEGSDIGVVIGCAVFATMTLYVMTGYFRRLIGIICITDDEKNVKISHLTFWGRKKDIIIPLKDIIPLGDCDCNPNDVYVKVQRYSSSDYLYLTLKYGQILDKSKFELVFGDLDVLGFTK